MRPWIFLACVVAVLAAMWPTDTSAQIFRRGSACASGNCATGNCAVSVHVRVVRPRAVVAVPVPVIVASPVVAVTTRVRARLVPRWRVRVRSGPCWRLRR